MRILIIIGLLLVSLTLSAQGRDTLVTKQLYYLERDSAAVDTQKIWSSKLTDYIEYSRLEMGNRMNQGLFYQKRAKKQLIIGMSGIALGAITYTIAGHSDPTVYIENHHKYTRSYFNDARNKRDALIITGSLLTAAGAYFVWRSYENNKKSRWSISPNGIRYNFGGK